ncbi:hypothetical protein [Gracilinema caldarium]|uniref:hypothetical protein n=1 Tax=Gracilinema caldarium TaxID=215591 RepID=UPI0012EA2ED3|nr:hypothetical protein [Gracilinema caldarium]
MGNIRNTPNTPKPIGFNRKVWIDQLTMLDKIIAIIGIRAFLGFLAYSMPKPFWIMALKRKKAVLKVNRKDISFSPAGNNR